MADKKYSIILAASDQTRAAFDSAKRNIQGLEAPLLSIKSAFGALAGGLVISTLKNLSDEYLQAAMSSNKLAAVLRSTGYAAGLTAAELENLVQQTSRMALIDDEQVRDGVSALLLFRNVQGDVAKAAIRLGAEMTQLGGDMSSAMQQIGSALESPLDAGKKLKAMGVFVSDGQQEMIKSMMESGDIAGAQGMILDLLNAKYGDLSATMNTGAIADSKRLTIAWGELLETMGKAPAESGLSGWAASRLTEINNIIEQSTIAERTMLMIPGLRTYARAAIAGRAAESGSQASAAEQAQADAGAVLKAQQDLQQKLDAFLANDEQEGMKRLKRISDATKKQNEEDDKDVIEKAKKAYEYGEKQTADLINKQQERFIAMRQMAEDSDASDLERSQLKQERLLADLEQQRMIMATDHELTLAELEAFEQAKADIENAGGNQRLAVSAQFHMTQQQFARLDMLTQARVLADGMSGMLATAGTKYRAFFEINKAYRTADAVITGVKAVQDSYAFGTTFGGPIAGAAMAAIAAAATAANVAAIQGASFGGGMGSYGAGGGSGGMPIMTPSPLAPEPPQPAQRAQGIIVSVNLGDDPGMPGANWIRKFADLLNEQIRDGVVIDQIRVN